MSPEICARDKYSGQASDVWAAGIILYSILFGSQPFKAKNEQDLYKKIMKGQYTLPAINSAKRPSSSMVSPGRQTSRSPQSGKLSKRVSGGQLGHWRFESFQQINNVEHIRGMIADMLHTKEDDRITA